MDSAVGLQEAPPPAMPEARSPSEPLMEIRTGIPPLSDVQEDKTDFLNGIGRPEKTPWAVQFHLVQGTGGLRRGVFMNEAGEIHTAPIPDSEIQQYGGLTKFQKAHPSVWVMEEDSTTERLEITRDGRMYGKKEGYTTEELNGEKGIFLPCDEKTGEGIGISYFNSHLPATDAKGTSVGIFHYNGEGLPPIIPIPEPIPVPEPKPVIPAKPENPNRWLERIKRLIPLIPLIGLAFLRGSQTSSSPAVRMPEVYGSPPDQPPPVTSVNNPVYENPIGGPITGRDQIEKPQLNPGFVHENTKGLSLTGLTDHWLAMIYEELNNPGEADTLYKSEMNYRETNGAEGERVTDDDPRLAAILNQVDDRLREIFHSEVRMSILGRSENKDGMVTDPNDPDQDKIVTDKVYMDQPLDLMKKATQRYKDETGNSPISSRIPGVQV